jgi:hypothetical protein
LRNRRIRIKLSKCEFLKIKDWEGWQVKRQWKERSGKWKNNISPAKYKCNKGLCCASVIQSVCLSVGPVQ